MAGPVRVAIYSVARTIIAAIGTMASAAAKNSSGGDTLPACSSATAMGMNANSQFNDGLRSSFLLSYLFRFRT